MHSAIVVVVIPEQAADWSMFLDALAPKAKHAKGAERLAENIWMIHLQKDPTLLGWLIALADQRGLKYRILPFERAPQWLPAVADSSTK